MVMATGIFLQLSSSGDTSVRLWDTVGGALLTTFKAHTGSVKSVDVKSDEPSECRWCLYASWSRNILFGPLTL